MRTSEASKNGPRVKRIAGVLGVPSGLFAGLAGLAFATRLLSRDGTRYQCLLDTLDWTLCSRVLGAAGAVAGRHGLAVSEFDLISGLTGIGAYLLTQGGIPPGDVALGAIVE